VGGEILVGLIHFRGSTNSSFSAKRSGMRTLVCLSVFFLAAISAHAIPNSFFSNGTSAFPVIPAFPRFNAELTEEFLLEKNWKDGELPGPWEEEASLDGAVTQRMSANPVLFGEVPMTVLAYSDGSGVDEIAIHFLDAGMYFGYRFGGEKTKDERADGRDRRAEFSRHYKRIADDVRDRLEDGCGRGKEGAMGRTAALRTVYTDYQWEDFTLRFVEREDHSVSLHILKKSEASRGLTDPKWNLMNRREREALFETNVRIAENGDRVVSGIPMFTQGTTPFCGVHSLAMVGQYLGLRARPEALAAAADFKNTGSAKGSDLVDLHRAVGAELDMDVSIAPDFKLNRVERSIQQGLPVIVWRRVSAEREKGRNGVALALTEDELAALPDKSERGSPSHASIVTGFNADRGEVIFTEPWGEGSRDRRMTLEEMEATAYAVFFFKL